ncbi:MULTISPECIES: DUF262 domain-containing protein [Vibrio harveyi group]|uniref:DUF262 domain-containing protein n=1 Tax=Vibrio harveyi group TaxID=717610 RepID=UPI00111E8F2B|nr:MULTISPECIES: DUF262 domain-containing protein [Vibrio harveyi group]MCR9310427.1 DUF262 domain-containing protein [Vibrio diabolicus]TOI25347.1 hypothetical protein CGI64_20435 [Vibrio parahaemolyticus]
MAVLNRESNTITLAAFWENVQLDKYDFDPGYQRESVWSDEKQAFLIDSILKNIPLPPIFLHQTIEDKTGKTSFAVIDGKQRLTSIIRFIKGEISSASDEDDSPLFDPRLAGLEFADLEKEELIDVRRAFWRYSIPIEYVDTDQKEVVDAIFDRLNRNGEPLEGQELRRAKYYGSELLDAVEEFSRIEFWRCRLEHVDVRRMEDREFISEILFYLFQQQPLKSDQAELDRLYSEYVEQNIDWESIKLKFLRVTNYMEEFALDYDAFKVSGVSHLYAIWGVALHGVENNTPPQYVGKQLAAFYKVLRSNKELREEHIEYKKSMSSSTRMKSARVKRVEALINGCSL